MVRVLYHNIIYGTSLYNIISLYGIVPVRSPLIPHCQHRSAHCQHTVTCLTFILVYCTIPFYPFKIIHPKETAGKQQTRDEGLQCASTERGSQQQYTNKGYKKGWIVCAHCHASTLLYDNNVGGMVEFKASVWTQTPPRHHSKQCSSRMLSFWNDCTTDIECSFYTSNTARCNGRLFSNSGDWCKIFSHLAHSARKILTSAPLPKQTIIRPSNPSQSPHPPSNPSIDISWRTSIRIDMRIYHKTTNPKSLLRRPMSLVHIVS